MHLLAEGGPNITAFNKYRKENPGPVTGLRESLDQLKSQTGGTLNLPFIDLSEANLLALT